MTDATVDDEFDALDHACVTYFGPQVINPSSSTPCEASVDAALALVSLADGPDVLGGLAAPDMAMAIAKMLGLCTNCTRHPSVASVAFDKDKHWFDVSQDLCCVCFHERAVRLHEAVTGQYDFPVTTPPPSVGHGMRADADDLSREEALETIARLVQCGAARPLEIGSRGCKRLLRGHWGSITAVAYSPAGTTIATCSTDRTTRLWAVASGECLQMLDGHVGDVTSVAYSPDGKTIATGSGDKTVREWDVSSGKCRRMLRGHREAVTAVAWSPDGRTIASGSWDRSVRLWDAVTGECRCTLDGHHGDVLALACSPDASSIVTGCADRCVRQWNLQSGERLGAIKPSPHINGNVAAVVYSTLDAAKIITGSSDSTARVWDWWTAECQLVLEGHTSAVCAVSDSPDGSTIVTGSCDTTARMWDALSGECRRVLRGHTGSVTTVAYSPCGAMIATGSGDHTVRLWDAA